MKIGQQVIDVATGEVGQLVSVGETQSTILVDGSRRRLRNGRLKPSWAKPRVEEHSRERAERKQRQREERLSSMSELAREVAEGMARRCEAALRGIRGGKSRLRAARLLAERLDLYKTDLEKELSK